MARRAPTLGEDFDEHQGVPSPSTVGNLPRMKTVPSYRTAVRHSIDGPEGTPPDGSRSHSDAQEPRAAWMASLPSYRTSVQTPAEDTGAPRAMWPPSAVVKQDRMKATAIWTLLLASFGAYIGYLSLNSLEMRENPPVQIKRKDEPFQLPDVVFCPSAGDGCDDSDGSACLPMDWYLSSLEGLSGECDKYFATPSPAAAPTPVPTPGPTRSASTLAPGTTSAPVAASPQAPVNTFSPGATLAPGTTLEPAHSISPIPSPSPVVVPAIRLNVETRANEWCPRVPLSECTVDFEGIESGRVLSLHASFYVLWDDMVSPDPAPSTRRFVNMFFVDEDVNVTDAVVAVRLPYDRVNITGTDPFTFSSNDVILSMSQYVHLDSNGKAGSTERTYTQATTTAQQTLRLDTFEGEEYEGALLYVTLSVNNFAYQSIEEVDPVDWWALAGSAGGMWEIICVVFGACFVAREVVGPDKKWGWARSPGKAAGGRGCRCCMKCGGCKI